MPIQQQYALQRGRFWGVMLVVVFVGAVVACTSAPAAEDPLPTVVDLTMHPTNAFLTQQAPPAGYRDLTTLSAIDNTLRAQTGWTYTVSATFDGIYDVTGEAVTGTLSARIQGNEPSQRRRVVIAVESGVFLPYDGILQLEGVRFSNDYYIVDINGVCTADQGGQMVGSEVADLSAGNLIGGVTRAIPTGHQRTIEGLRAWQYTFAADAMQLPAILRRTDSRIELNADLWFAPEVNAALLYEVTANVARVHLLWADQTQSTVSGTLYLRYELDIATLGDLPNISVPHGC